MPYLDVQKDSTTCTFLCCWNHRQNATMSSNMNQAIECAVCLHILRKPIRNLSCGHAFCEECMVRSSRWTPSQIRCPICRQQTRLALHGVEGLPRNWIVENLLDQQELSSNSSCASKCGQAAQRLNVTRDALPQLKELASIYKREKKFKAAIDILQIIINQVQSYCKIKPMIDLSDCLLETNQKQEALKVCRDLAHIVNSHNLTSFEEMSCVNCDDDLRRLAQAFISVDYETSIMLNRCSYKLSKIFYDGKDKLTKLATTAFAMTQIADVMKQVNKIDDFKDQLPFMEEILEDMQQMTCDDVKFKCLEITMCLHRIGYCCNKTKMYRRSIGIHKQAIDLMKSVFGYEAKKYEVFGICHYILGNAYEYTDQTIEAERAYMKAKEIFETVKHWNDVEHKVKAISGTNNNIHHVSQLCAIQFN